MATSSNDCSPLTFLSDALATATQTVHSAANVASAVAQIAADNFLNTTALMSKTIPPTAQRWVEEGTETVGKVVTPIAENPLMKYATKIPGINILAAALGQVDIEKAEKDVQQLRQTYPLETAEQLAHRIMVDTAVKAGGIGLVTNFVPPLALALFAVDLAAVTALQAEMVYRIAYAYGFALNDPTRRGEVMAIFGLSAGGSTVLKGGLSVIELLPIIGAMIGASSDAALIYALGYVACQFYENKKKSTVITSVEVS